MSSTPTDAPFIDGEMQNRCVVFRWEQPSAEPERIDTSPLLEAKRYASILSIFSILQRDPFVKTQADLAREMGVSRVRITFFSENRLRPLTQIDESERQLEEFQKLLAQVPPLQNDS